MIGSSFVSALKSIEDVIPVIGSNSHADIGSLRLINALEIATFGDVIFVYPVPPNPIVRDDILDDVETIDVMIPGNTSVSSNI